MGRKHKVLATVCWFTALLMQSLSDMGLFQYTRMHAIWSYRDPSYFPMDNFSWATFCHHMVMTK